MLNVKIPPLLNLLKCGNRIYVPTDIVDAFRDLVDFLIENTSGAQETVDDFKANDWQMTNAPKYGPLAKSNRATLPQSFYARMR